MPSFQILVLSFLFVSFHPSLFRSHSRSTGACLLLSPSAFFLSFSTFFRPLLFPVSITQPLFLPFLCFPSFASQLLPRCSSSAFASYVFHFLFRLVSHASFPVSSTWLSVCFLSSLSASLPQLFHRCFPYSLPGFFPLLRFLSSTSIWF